jgi:hypothetical protein
VSERPDLIGSLLLGLGWANASAEFDRGPRGHDASALPALLPRKEKIAPRAAVFASPSTTPAASRVWGGGARPR